MQFFFKKAYFVIVFIENSRKSKLTYNNRRVVEVRKARSLRDTWKVAEENIVLIVMILSRVYWPVKAYQIVYVNI